MSLNQRGGNMIVHGKQYLQNTEINGVEFADDLYAGFFFLLFFFSGSMQSIRMQLARIHLF